MILAILNPNKKFTLIDRKTTFIDFLGIVKSELKLKNVVIEKQDFFNNKHTYIKHVKESLLDIKKYNIVLPNESLDPENYTIKDIRLNIKNSIQKIAHD